MGGRGCGGGGVGGRGWRIVLEGQRGAGKGGGRLT